MWAFGGAHNLNILMNGWQNAYILLVIILLQLAAACLLWKRARFGYLILLLSMLGALVFGGYYHFVLAGADNVSTVAHYSMRSWGQVFRVSAVVLALVEFAGWWQELLDWGNVNRESLSAVNGEW
ncbi:MAG TPA: hypothetical protein DC047_04400 [Blastocatellia bacterium]|nr:hypothetical protein [Blastocatellia bacterium]